MFSEFVLNDLLYFIFKNDLTINYRATRNLLGHHNLQGWVPSSATGNDRLHWRHDIFTLRGKGTGIGTGNGKYLLPCGTGPSGKMGASVPVSFPYRYQSLYSTVCSILHNILEPIVPIPVPVQCEWAIIRLNTVHTVAGGARTLDEENWIRAFPLTSVAAICKITDSKL